MGIEIERKFLVQNEDWRALVENSLPCTQGYVDVRGSGSFRVRVMGSQGFLTIKGSREGLSRPEFEYEIPIDEARCFLDSFCEEPVISKIRHYVTFKETLWEIDEFLGDNQGLTLAEVELTREDQSIELPSWVGKDVSTDDRFFNARLAKHPISKWTPKA